MAWGTIFRTRLLFFAVYGGMFRIVFAKGSDNRSISSAPIRPLRPTGCMRFREKFTIAHTSRFGEAPCRRRRYRRAQVAVSSALAIQFRNGLEHDDMHAAGTSLGRSAARRLDLTMTWKSLASVPSLPCQKEWPRLLITRIRRYGPRLRGQLNRSSSVMPSPHICELDYCE